MTQLNLTSSAAREWARGIRRELRAAPLDRDVEALRDKYSDSARRCRERGAMCAAVCWWSAAMLARTELRVRLEKGGAQGMFEAQFEGLADVAEKAAKELGDG